MQLQSLEVDVEQTAHHGGARTRRQGTSADMPGSMAAMSQREAKQSNTVMAEHSNPLRRDNSRKELGQNGRVAGNSRKSSAVTASV